MVGVLACLDWTGRDRRCEVTFERAVKENCQLYENQGKALQAEEKAGMEDLSACTGRHHKLHRARRGQRIEMGKAEPDCVPCLPLDFIGKQLKTFQRCDVE